MNAGNSIVAEVCRYQLWKVDQRVLGDGFHLGVDNVKVAEVGQESERIRRHSDEHAALNFDVLHLHRHLEFGEGVERGVADNKDLQVNEASQGFAGQALQRRLFDKELAQGPFVALEGASADHTDPVVTENESVHWETSECAGGKIHNLVILQLKLVDFWEGATQYGEGTNNLQSSAIEAPGGKRSFHFVE